MGKNLEQVSMPIVERVPEAIGRKPEEVTDNVTNQQRKEIAAILAKDKSVPVGFRVPSGIETIL